MQAAAAQDRRVLRRAGALAVLARPDPPPDPVGLGERPALTADRTPGADGLSALNAALPVALGLVVGTEEQGRVSGKARGGRPPVAAHAVTPGTSS